MLRIAVCLSGQIRYWKEISPFFEHWNNLFDNVEFTFFVSTWNSETWVDKKFGGCIEYEDIDFTKYDFIKAHSKHDSNNAQLANKHKKPCTPYLTYLLNKVQTLRKKYETENNFEFDGIIQTRNDIFITSELLNLCVKLANDKPYFFNYSMFTPSPIALDRVGGFKGGFSIILSNDNFYFGSSQTMDKFMNIYTYLHTDAIKLHTHYLQAEFFMRNNIPNIHLKKMPVLIRDGIVKKNGRPTPDSLRKIVLERGVDWALTTPYKQISEEYWTHK
tara:strand:- start:351 stop:1172 length:822 start_codon:yes stop_codon:yes gene_type:complete